MEKIILIQILLILDFFVINKIFGQETEPITMTIIYDNTVFTKGLESDWGFSCLIEGTEKTILFDTGAQSRIFLTNLGKLKINPKNVEFVVISHNHGDHTGGLNAFLQENNNVTVFLPASSPEQFINTVKKTNAKVKTEKEPVEICKNVYLTGEMGSSIKEQSIILNTSKGLIIIAGCAHPGIVNIVKRAKEIVNKKIYLVFGGFHLAGKSEADIERIIQQFRELGVMKVGATHCTGEKAIEIFKETYAENYIQMGVGRVLHLSKDGIK